MRFALGRSFVAPLAAPRVSVVLAAYQAEGLIDEALERLAGLGGDIEVVLVDDGSTDATAAAMTVAAESDPRFQAVLLPVNGGLGAARRAGFAAARGDYVWNVDVDDDWPSDALAALDAVDEDADLILFAARRRRRDDSLVPVDRPPLPESTDARGLLELLLDERITGHLWNKLVGRRLRESADAYTDVRIHSDLVMLLGFLPGVGRVAVRSSEIYTYIERDGSNITSRRRRGDGLDAATAALARAVEAVAPDLRGTPRLLAWESKILILSALRDAVRADYTPEEARQRFRQARSRIRVRGIFALAHRDRGSAVKLAVALVAAPVFRWAMRPRFR